MHEWYFHHKKNSMWNAWCGDNPILMYVCVDINEIVSLQCWEMMMKKEWASDKTNIGVNDSAVYIQHSTADPFSWSTIMWGIPFCA